MIQSLPPSLFMHSQRWLTHQQASNLPDCITASMWPTLWLCWVTVSHKAKTIKQSKQQSGSIASQYQTMLLDSTMQTRALTLPLTHWTPVLTKPQPFPSHTPHITYVCGRPAHTKRAGKPTPVGKGHVDKDNQYKQTVVHPGIGCRQG